MAARRPTLGLADVEMMSEPVEIEVPHGGSSIDEGGSADWRRSKAASGDVRTGEANQSPSALADFLDEPHHRSYGRPWVLGKCQFDCLRSAGLTPAHRVMDFGCGAGRLGIWLIPFLDADRYCGVEGHYQSLEAFARYEIPVHDLEHKRPRLLNSLTFDFAHFGREFDWIVDFFSSAHVEAGRLPRLYRAYADVLADGGTLAVVPAPQEPPLLEAEGFRLSQVVTWHCGPLEGSRYVQDDAWHLLRRD